MLLKNVLDRRRWRTRHELHEAIVSWVERTYNRPDANAPPAGSPPSGTNSP